MDKEADKVIRELGDAWADVERWKKKAAEWERISDQMEHRLMQIADIVKHIKTADGFDPVCSNEIVAAVEKLRAEVEKLTRERDEARASFASICRHSDEQRLELDRLRKSPLLSRLDEFAKAALTGICTTFDWTGPYDLVTIGSVATQVAQATIRAIDGAGGA